MTRELEENDYIYKDNILIDEDLKLEKSYLIKKLSLIKQRLEIAKKLKGFRDNIY